MTGAEKLAKQLHLMRLYGDLLDQYNQTPVSEVLDHSDKEFGGRQDWEYHHYFDVGRDALRIIIRALVSCLRNPPDTILDFPSGSGRVTRHLKAFFPDAQITACDLYPGHVAFCADTFGVDGHLSNEDVDKIDFGKRFDLIFCGSLLTHLPERDFVKALKLMARSLSREGIAVVTVHGRHSPFIQRNKWKYLSDDLFANVQDGFEKNGFGYVDYPSPFRSQKFNRQARYGISLAKPSWTLSRLEVDEQIRIEGYFERDWDDHQDVVIFIKPGIHSPT
jgi:SAM-dependent methyltransferase